jgi:hypothetical protein
MHCVPRVVFDVSRCLCEPSSPQIGDSRKVTRAWPCFVQSQHHGIRKRQPFRALRNFAYLTFPRAHLTFPRAHPTFPRAHPTFPRAYLTFPCAHPTFPCAHLTFPNAHLAFLGAHLAFPRAHLAFPRAHLAFPRAHLAFPRAHLAFPPANPAFPRAPQFDFPAPPCRLMCPRICSRSSSPDAAALGATRLPSSRLVSPIV